MVILSIDPPILQLPASGGISVHVLVNSGEARVTFKIKSSNNVQYRVNPVYGFVDPSSAATIEITRMDGQAKADKLVVQYIEVQDDEKGTAQNIFKKSSPHGEILLPMITF